MAANTSPIFILTPVSPVVQISTANTNRDGTGTLGTLITGGTNGTIIDLIRIVATGTTTAGVIRIFLDNTVNVRLLDEILVTAITPSTTVKVFEYNWVPPTIYQFQGLPNGYIIKVSTHNAETFNVFAFGGDF